MAPGEMDSGARLDVAAALEQLRPAERLCVVLAHAEEMSHSEIAAVTGLPLGTVKSHVTRGTVKLRRWMGADAVSTVR